MNLKGCLILLIMCFGFSFAFSVYGNSDAEVSTLIPRYSVKHYRDEIDHIYQWLNQPGTLSEKVKKVSQYFLGARYQRGALGEGPRGEFDQNPLYRTDAFDCVTYVSTVIALTHSHNFSEFLNHLKKIHYKNSMVAFENRFHFIELDWNRYNIRHGYLKEITHYVSKNTRVAVALINKPAWYNQLSADKIKLFYPISQKQLKNQLENLHQLSASQNLSYCPTEYIPLTELFIKKGDQVIANKMVFARIPTGSVIEIIDKTRECKIGTELNIIHLGLAVWTKEGLMLRHASITHERVIDVPMISYFKRYYLTSNFPDWVGISVLKIV